MTKDEALKRAREALLAAPMAYRAPETIVAIDKALEHPAQQEPVAWMDRDGDLYATEPDKNWCPPHYPLYANPQARAWVGIDAGDWNKISYTSEFRAGADWAEAKLKEKNT